MREVTRGSPSWNSDGALDDETDKIDPGREVLLRSDFADTGITTPSPPRPNLENLGVGSVLVTQFVPGSRDIDGRRASGATGGGGRVSFVDTGLASGSGMLGLVNERSGAHDIRDGLYLGIA